jgi:hypothetical protein
VFIDHQEPKDSSPLNPDKYAAMLMNPIHNLDNLPANYMATLDELPDRERRRFKEGQWTIPEGAIFPEYGEHMLIPHEDIPDCEKYVVGVDLVTYAAVLLGFQRYTREKTGIHWKCYVIDEWHQDGALAHDAEAAIESLWGGEYQFTKVLDHNLGKAGTREFTNSRLARKEQGSVEAGIVQMQSLMHLGDFYVAERCRVLHYELENYHRDELGAVVKQDDHHIDAARMSIYTTIRKRREIRAA